MAREEEMRGGIVPQAAVDRSSEATVDWISGLPYDLLIDRILVHVPIIDSVRMSLLSRNWRNIWRLIPVLNFRETNRSRQVSARASFRSFVNWCLNERTDDILLPTEAQVKRFKLEMDLLPADKMSLDSWLALLFSSPHLKEFTLSLRAAVENLYTLPVSAFGLGSLKAMKLCGVKLKFSSSVDLPNLVSLTLENVKLEDEMLDKVVTSCCSLKYLQLRQCVGLVHARIQSSGIEHLQIVCGSHRHAFLETMFSVVTKNLHSLKYGGSRYASLDLISVGTLQDVSLTNIMLHDDGICDIMKMPLVEKLDICNVKCEHLNIDGQHLKQINLRGVRNGDLIKATINTPSLVIFTFQGDILGDIYIDAPNLKEGKLQLRNPDDHDVVWYFSLLDFLRYFDHAARLSVTVCSEEGLIFPVKFKNNCLVPLPRMQNLLVNVKAPMERMSELRDSLTWLAPSSLATLITE